MIASTISRAAGRKIASCLTEWYRRGPTVEPDEDSGYEDETGDIYVDETGATYEEA